MSDFKPGDSVSWNTPQGKTEGKIEQKLTRPASIKGHKVQASTDNPQYKVKSSSSGKSAAHKPESLHDS